MTELFNGAYSGKKVLVTGHTGFKGSWLSLWLTELGADVAGYSLGLPTNPSLFEILKLDNRISHHIGDIRDKDGLYKVFSGFKPEIVFHLAAQPLVRLSYREPVETYETNIMGTVNVLEAVRRTESVRAAVVITSDKCYENREWPYGYRENEAMGGYDPYSSSKGCAELVTAAYRNSFFNPLNYNKTHQTGLASARAGNVIGGGDWAADRLIPDCARALSENKTVVLRNPASTRPWQHVIEPLSGYLFLAEKLLSGRSEYAGGWNFGPADDDIRRVEDVVKLFISGWGKGKYEIKKDGALHEAHLLKLDISKARYGLGWTPVLDAAEAVRETMLWYREYYEDKNPEMSAFTANQIRKYIGSAAKQKAVWTERN